MAGNYQITNEPTKPGLYWYRWTYGDNDMKQWRKAEVYLKDGKLWVKTMKSLFDNLGDYPLETFFDSEWSDEKEKNDNRTT